MSLKFSSKYFWDFESWISLEGREEEKEEEEEEEP